MSQSCCYFPAQSLGPSFFLSFLLYRVHSSLYSRCSAVVIHSFVPSGVVFDAETDDARLPLLSRALTSTCSSGLYHLGALFLLLASDGVFFFLSVGSISTHWKRGEVGYSSLGPSHLAATVHVSASGGWSSRCICLSSSVLLLLFHSSFSRYLFFVATGPSRNKSWGRLRRAEPRQS